MELRTKVGVGVALVVVGLVGFGCTPRSVEVEPVATTTERPTPRPAKSTKKAPTTEAPTPVAATESVVTAPAPIDQPPRETAFAPAFRALALEVDELGNELGGESSFSVDPLFATMTFSERDVSIAGLPRLRRAIRPIFDASSGLFGVGWRSEVEASLHRDGEGLLLVDLHGAQAFEPNGAGRWVSSLGKTRELAQIDGGFTVKDLDGRRTTYDRDGRLTSIAGELTIERLPGALRLVGTAGAVTLELDPTSGRVVRGTGPGVDLRYVYDGAWLAEVQGTARRDYAFGVDAKSAWFQIGGPQGTIANLAGVNGGRFGLALPGLLGDEIQVYTFADMGVVTDGPLVHAAFSVKEEGVVRVEVEGERFDTPVDERFQPIEPAAAEETPAPVGATERDANGQVSGVQFPGGQRVNYGRDATGRVVEEHGPAGTLTFARDAQGRVVRRADAAGTSISAVRDRAGRVESFAGAEGSEVSFEHDAAGRPTKIATEGYELRWRWDAQGRFVQETGPDATLIYAHDATGEQVTTPWGAFARRKDATGHVTTLETPAGTFALSRDGEGRLVRVRAPNGTVTEIARDAAGRESRRTVKRGRDPVLELTTARDAAGKATRLVRDGALIAFERDESGRLTGAEGAGLGLAYDWTASGDRVDATRTLEHDAAGRLVRQVGPEGEIRYGWSDLGRLVRVETRQAGRTSVVEYGYDGLGRLVRRTTAAGTTRYVHENGQVVAELGPGERVRVWIHGPGTDEPLAYGDGKGWTFLHGDATWTTLAYTDANGARVGQAVVGPFGEVVQGAAERPALFAGRVIDPETGLVNLRARWYLPALGRFLDADAVGIDGGSNPWLYCQGDPVEARDPLGFSPEDQSGLGPAVAPRGLVRRARTAATPAQLQAVAAAQVALSTASAADLDARWRDYQLALYQAGLIDAPTRDRAAPVAAQAERPVAQERATARQDQTATKTNSPRSTRRTPAPAPAPAPAPSAPTFGLSQVLDADAELGSSRLEWKDSNPFGDEDSDRQAEEDRRQARLAKAAAREERIREATRVVEAAKEAELSYRERLDRALRKAAQKAYDTINVPVQAGLSAFRSIRADGFLGNGNAGLAPSDGAFSKATDLGRRRGDFVQGGTHNADLTTLGETGQDVVLDAMTGAAKGAAAMAGRGRTLEALAKAKKGAEIGGKVVDNLEKMSKK